ncbi:MAG TPA: response regulator [Geothrix sp.]|nr:response regulator [Geothrix sp.]
MTADPARFLYLEDDSRDVEPVAERLKQTGIPFELRVARDRPAFQAALAAERFDLIFSDYLLPSYDGMSALALAREMQPEVPFILISGVLGEEQAVDCVLKGATDYVLKHHLDRLVPATQRALREAEERRLRRQAEEDRAKLQEQLQRAGKMESLGILAGGVAHDMNNVLGAILGLASANLDLHPEPSPTRRAFETICKAATRGGEMVKNLLNFARQSPAEEREVDLNAILQEEVRLLERTTLSKIRLELDLAPDLRPVRGDGSALSHAMLNLCVNAVDAMSEQGVLRLATRNLEAGGVEVRVEDSGAGMPEEVLKRALDPFFTTKAPGRGTGLGLSMVYSVVKTHRGELDIESQPGRGTCVTLRFPAMIQPRASGPAEPAPHQAASARPLRALLVDDDELFLESAQRVLEVLGHAVTTSRNGEEALSALASGLQPDVVVLDMNMPGLGGPDTLRGIRGLRPAVPVLLITGRADLAAITLQKTYPKVALLPKPFSLEAFKRHLEILDTR